MTYQYIEIGVFVVCVLVLVFMLFRVARMYAAGQFKEGGYTEIISRPLSEFRHRESLTQLLQLNRIVGDAVIRNGEVMPAADTDKAGIFSRMLMGAYSQAKANGLPSGANLYFAVPYDGAVTGWAYKCFGDFGIGDAAAIANILDRQAALICELRRELTEATTPAPHKIKPRCKACRGTGITRRIASEKTKSCDSCGGTGKEEG